MKLQKILSLFLFFAFLGVCFMLCGFTFFKNENKVENLQKVQTSTNYSDAKDNLWCVTFQLVWNDFMDKVNNGQPIKFVGGNPTIADELNKKSYTTDILKDEDYFKTQGKVSKKLKKQIKKSLKSKFNEKSDILDMIDWSAKNSYLFYTMLKKNFTFLYAFDKLAAAPFNSSSENVKYFGINEASDYELINNVKVLFYSPDEYAVKLSTKENEDVILFRTDRQDSFENMFSYIVSKSEFSPFDKKDTLKVPFLSVDELISYDELCMKSIEGTNEIISQAIQTIKFNMDNKGGSLKSEAAMITMKTALIPEEQEPRFFLFDKPFFLFLIEEGKNKPYYAMKVSDTKYLVKE